MTKITKIRILKILGIVLLIVFIPFLLFYLGLVLPEYCACSKIMFEGQKGVNIWGDTVDCDGESVAFSEAFFQLCTLINFGFLIAFTVILICYRKLKIDINPKSPR